MILASSLSFVGVGFVSALIVFKGESSTTMSSSLIYKHNFNNLLTSRENAKRNTEALCNSIELGTPCTNVIDLWNKSHIELGFLLDVHGHVSSRECRRRGD